MRYFIKDFNFLLFGVSHIFAAFEWTWFIFLFVNIKLLSNKENALENLIRLSIDFNNTLFQIKKNWSYICCDGIYRLTMVKTMVFVYHTFCYDGNVHIVSHCGEMSGLCTWKIATRLHVCDNKVMVKYSTQKIIVLKWTSHRMRK